MSSKRNSLTPEYFYESVAKKTKVDVATVRSIYTAYLRRVAECLKTEDKVMLKGLGSVEISPRKCLGFTFGFIEQTEKTPEEFLTDEVSEKNYRWYKQAEKVYKKAIELKPTYEYIERSIEKFRVNHRGLDEFFDNEGNCRRDFKIQKRDMQDMSFHVEKQGGVCNAEN